MWKILAILYNYCFIVVLLLTACAVCDSSKPMSSFYWPLMHYNFAKPILWAKWISFLHPCYCINKVVILPKCLVTTITWLSLPKKFTTQEKCQLLLQWIDWALAKLSSNAKILISLHTHAPSWSDDFRAHFRHGFFPQIAAGKEFSGS